MSNDIKVSVVVPVYNHEKYLRQCVDSIVSQTLKEIEIILVDNGSTDGCPQICDEYAVADSRIHVIHIENNVGACGAYNSGMKLAKGEYVGFVDSDDWIEPQMYEKLYSKALELNVDVVKSLFRECKENVPAVLRNKFGQFAPFNKRLTDPLQTPAFVYGHISMWSAIYRKKFLEQEKIILPSSPEAFQDMVFCWEVYVKMHSYCLLPEAFYNYRISPSQSIALGWKAAMFVIRAHELINEQLKRDQVPNDFKEIRMKFLYLSYLASWNNPARLHGVRRIYFAKAIANIAKSVAGNIKFTEFTNAEKIEFLRVLRHPVWYGVKHLIYKKENNPAYAVIKFSGIKLYEKKKTAQCDTRKLLYLPVRKETFDKQGSKISYIGLPLKRVEKQGNMIKKRFLGIRYKTKQSPAKPAAPQSPAKPAAPQSPAKPAAPAPYTQDVRMLKAACYANAIAEVHKQTFPKYKNSLRGQDIMVVACGPTVHFAPILPDIKHLAVNRAITMKKYHYDFCFMIDYPAIREHISVTFDYGCINFFGKYVYDPCRGFSIPDSVAELAHAERFYSEVPWASTAYHDIEHFPLTDFGTIVHPALSFLLYTRPRRIYLVGCDTANTGYFEKGVYQKPMNISLLKSGYVKLKQIRDIYYPEVEIVSINPVGLRGMFKDMYTRAYLKEHPEINVEEENIIKED